MTEWIAHGSDPTVSYALLSEKDTLKHIIGDKWLKPNIEQPKYAFDFAGSELIEKLNGPYRTVVQKSPDSPPALDVSIFGRGAFKKEFLTELSQVKEQVVYLNLSNLPVDNNLLQSISNLNNLEHLVLNFTDISRGSTSILTKNEKLSSLSLAGTAIDFSDLKELKQLKNLKELFVWNTQVSDTELKLLQDEMPSVSINEGYIPNPPEEQLNLTPPVLLGEKNIVKTGGATISLAHKMNGLQIRYTLDGSEPDENAKLYEGDIVLDLEGKRSKTIKAIAYKEEWLPSEVASFEFFDQGLKPEHLEVTYPGVLSAYTGRAEEILNDDLKNDANTYYYSKHWASFREKPLEAIADFGNSNTGISEIILSCGLRPNQKESTIDFVSVWSSNDKENWQLLKRLNLSNETNLSQLKKVSLKFPKTSNRYFKIVGQPKKNQLLRANQLFFF